MIISKRGECFSAKVVHYAFVLALTLLLSACGRSDPVAEDPDPQQVPINALKLQQPQNCEQLKDYIVTSLVERYTAIDDYPYYACNSTGGGGNSPPAGDSSDTVTTDPAPVAGGSGEARTPDDVSDTNNQEAGVNEADTVKADDNGVVYVISGRHLIITQGFPPQELNTLKELDLGAHGTHLFLDKTRQRLVVLARYDQPVYIAEPPVAAPDVAIAPSFADWDVTVAIFFDVSDPREPVMLDQIRFKGYYADGRHIDERVHLILRNYYDPQEFYQDAEAWRLRQNFQQIVNDLRCADPDISAEAIAVHPDVVAAKAAFADRVRAVLEPVDMNEKLPTAQRQTAQGELQSLEFLSCSDIRHPQVSASLGLQVIASMNTDGSNLGATAIVNNAWMSYASLDNLYIAETHRNWWRPVMDSASQTAIYKFAISSGTPQYLATGTVSGWAGNQFSFSEHNGALRVATTEEQLFYDTDANGGIIPRWERQNNVFVLRDDNAGNLNVSGEVRGFGRGEIIQSSRFLGDKGFVVTFRQIDPLFTFNLSDPENPRLMGELEIPGFSRYMHPYDDNHLITIGRAGGAGGIGTGTGIQLQLFDVSDLSAPVRLHTLTPSTPEGWSWSEAEYDHKAFTFYKPANLLAIPMQLSPATGTPFSGVAAYEVTPESGFRELGRVDHSDLAYQLYCSGDAALYPSYEPNCGNGWYMQWAAPRRSVVMTSGQDVYLYTISDVGIKAAHTGDLSATLGSVLFPYQPYPWWYIVLDQAGSPGGGTVAF